MDAVWDVDGTDLFAFCNRSAVDVAGALIGWDLQVNGAGGRIVETEAYTADDPASHSFRGPRKANGSMWLRPGSSYVYRIYGLHHCLNLVCAQAGAVLIRALEPLHGLALMRARRGQDDLRQLASGPGKLCQALDIDLLLDGLPMDQPPFSLQPPRFPSSRAGGSPISSGPRIGISRNTDIPWRFCATNSPFLSR